MDVYDVHALVVCGVDVLICFYHEGVTVSAADVLAFALVERSAWGEWLDVVLNFKLLFIFSAFAAQLGAVELTSHVLFKMTGVSNLQTVHNNLFFNLFFLLVLFIPREICFNYALV